MDPVVARVVIVDDDARFRAMARRVLVADGVDVVAEADSGADAIRGMASWHPDVVLLDIGLPDIDGVEVARQLLAATDPPVVVLISTRDVEYGQCVAAGLAAGYVPKDKLCLAAILDVIGPSPPTAA
jgi:DNA-binding NarL/FixJ family response regulator